MSSETPPVHAALQATEEAVKWMQLAVEAAQEGTRNAWEVQGDWQRAVRWLKVAQEQCEAAGRWPGYQLERDERGRPLRLWWRLRGETDAP